jgi:hypothetical protein
MRFIRGVFRVAGIFGLLVITPLYFMEARIGLDDPPEITHPEYYYGFVATCLAWQLMYLLISTDPVRYRTPMLLGAFGKLSFFISTLVLYLQGRVAPSTTALASIDLVFVVLFAIAWNRTPKMTSGGGPSSAP